MFISEKLGRVASIIYKILIVLFLEITIWLGYVIRVACEKFVHKRTDLYFSAVLFLKLIMPFQKFCNSGANGFKPRSSQCRKQGIKIKLWYFFFSCESVITLPDIDCASSIQVLMQEFQDKSLETIASFASISPQTKITKPGGIPLLVTKQNKN